MKILTRLDKVSKPLLQRRKILHDAFLDEVVKVMNQIIDEGLYTREELKSMPHEKFCDVISDYDFDNGRNVDKAGIILEETGG